MFGRCARIASLGAFAHVNIGVPRSVLSSPPCSAAPHQIDELLWVVRVERDHEVLIDAVAVACIQVDALEPREGVLCTSIIPCRAWRRLKAARTQRLDALILGLASHGRGNV
jgi:hypothetical protein